MESLLTAIVFYIVGFLSGFGVRSFFLTTKKELWANLQTKDFGRAFITILVTVVWFILVIAELFDSNYHVNPLIHGIFGSIVGYFFLINKKDDSKT